MGSAIALGDVVGEAQYVFVITVIPLQRDIDADALLLGGNGDRLSHQWLLVPVEIFHKGRDAAVVIQIVLVDFLMPLVAQQDAHTGVQECKFAIAMLQLVEIIFGDVLERVIRVVEGDACALLETVFIGVLFDLGCVPADLQRVHRLAMLEPHPMFFAIAPDNQLQPF